MSGFEPFFTSEHASGFTIEPKRSIIKLRAPSRLLANALSIASDIASGFEQTQRQSFSRSRAGEDGTDHLACAGVAGGFLFGHWAQPVLLRASTRLAVPKPVEKHNGKRKQMNTKYIL